MCCFVLMTLIDKKIYLKCMIIIQRKLLSYIKSQNKKESHFTTKPCDRQTNLQYI